MKKLSIVALSLLLVCSFTACKNYGVNKLKRQMKPLAKTYLQSEKVTDYDSLAIDFVDTVTELGYASLNLELLAQMEGSYQGLYNQAVEAGDSQKMEVVSLYLNDIERTRADFEELMSSGELNETNTLLFMVTGHYAKGKEKTPFIFFVKPDKESLYTMDPFGDNLLYTDENSDK